MFAANAGGFLCKPPRPTARQRQAGRIISMPFQQPYEFSPQQLRDAQWLVGEMNKNDGLAPLDVDRFWADDQIAMADPFGPDIPQVPLKVTMEGECVFDELGLELDLYRYLHDTDFRLSLNKAYNEKALAIVGKKLLRETAPDPDKQYPPVKGLADIFEAQNVWHDQSWWLQQSADTPAELAALLDRVDRRLENLRDFLLPPGWDEAKARLMPQGIRPNPYRFQRGPITFAASIYGAENLIFLLVDEPQLAGRFRDTMIRAMLAMGDIMDVEGAVDTQAEWRRWQFNDDNCCLMTPEMYEFFGYPILKAMFDRWCPAEGDWRYQHSDSAMGHLLGILSRLNFSGVNFGPTLSVAEIREAMPRTLIDGQLAPFTFSRMELENIVLEFMRDFDQARAGRGLRFACAGSVNNGSRLTGLRLIMSAIQHFGRY
jgi:uroporphyrinogen decarboxylase